ncbi:MAG: methyltransferase domain-containing protein [Candidatus Neomarinimicrobiota bacterium]
MSDTSIIYYTDCRLDPQLFSRCQEYLLRAAAGKRIISVSQQPLDFGDNICVGDIGRSFYNLFFQALAGAKAATTKYIALAEHDCFYSPEHFNWVPPTDEHFYYNVNQWLVIWGGKQSGLYSYFRRKVLSQLICNRELFIEAIEEKLKMLETSPTGACEPGVCDNRQEFMRAKAALKDVGKDKKNYRARAFRTTVPNLDVRHGGNFSVGRRAGKRRWTLAYWGDFKQIMDGTKTTIINYTDGSAPKILYNKVLEKLEETGLPLVVVKNDVSERSHLQMFRNIRRGLEQANTRYVALTEHDCVYPKEHFDFVPEYDDTFYYNVNHLFVRYKDGRYDVPYRLRRALSGLICNRDLLLKAVNERIAFLEGGGVLQRGIPGACEFGVIDDYKSDDFRSAVPYLDVRHKGNFSGFRKGGDRTFNHPYWGEFKQLLVPKGKWYQEAVINGMTMPTRRIHDTNEKRWKKFIEPLIELDSGFVTDLGCNAGFYCRKFAERGFRATGVERSTEFFRHAEYWESSDPRGVRLINCDITEYSLWTAHYVLLANVHYWLTPEDLEKLVTQCRNKALHVILIGRYNPYKGHKSPGHLGFLEKLFDGWNEGKVIKGDKHFSVIFSNPDLVARDVDDIFHFQQLYKSQKFLPSYNALIDDVLAGRKFDPLETEYFEYCRWRRFKNKAGMVQRHINLVYSMRDEGVREPLTIGRMVDGKYEPNRLVDGDHRLIVAKKLGIKSLICQVRSEG